MDTIYRINRLLMYLAMILYVPLTLALVAVLCLGAALLTTGVVNGAPKAGVSYRGFAWVMLFIGLLDLSVACVSFLLLAGLFRLFARFRDESVFGVPLSREQHPHFFELLDRVCKKLKVHAPAECYLSPFSEMSISDRTIEENGRVRRGVRTLVVGAGLLVHLRIDELTTILCHEMAHARAGDTGLCRLATRFNYAMIAAIYEHYEEETQSEQNTWLNTLVRLGLMAYFRLFSLLYAADERWCELRADRTAARICGPQNVRNMLIKINLAGYVPELSIEALLIEYSQDISEMGNLYREHKRRWDELPARRIEEAENQMFLDRHSLYDSHPCLAARIRGLKGIEAKEMAGEKPAMRLFSNWEQLEASMTEALVRRGRSLHRAYMAQLLGGR